MKQKKLPSLLGGSMIIAGTAIGAGMLANPTAMSGIWFLGSVILFLIIWGITTLSALMLLEANLHFEKGANFDTITTQLLGKGWNIFNGISVAFTLYILTYAYITSGGSITKSLLNRFVPELPINHTFSALLFCFVLALFVSISTKAVDRMSTILISGMVIAFFLSTTGLLSSAKSEILLNTIAHTETSYLPYLLSTIPTCLVSFGYHICVPTLVNYYDKKSNLFDTYWVSFSTYYLYILANGSTRKPSQRRICSHHSQGRRCSHFTKCFKPIYPCFIHRRSP